jgi:hypothetical protein
MTYSRQRRAELWISTAVTVLLVIVFAGVAIIKDVPALLWLAAPCIMLLPFLAWKAKRPDRVFEREQDRFNDFTKRHPVLWAILVLGALGSGLWTIGSFIYRMW